MWFAHTPRHGVYPHRELIAAPPDRLIARASARRTFFLTRDLDAGRAKTNHTMTTNLMKMHDEIRSKQAAYRKEVQFRAMMEVMEEARCEAALEERRKREAIMRVVEEAWKEAQQPRASRRQVRKSRGKLHVSTRRERLDQLRRSREKVKHRKETSKRLQTNHIRQGNMQDLVRHLRREGKAEGSVVDFSAVDPETRVAFYPRRRTNNSASTLMEVMDGEKWTPVRMAGFKAKFIV